MFNSFRKLVDMVFKGFAIVFMTLCVVMIVLMFKSCEGAVKSIDKNIEVAKGK